MFKHKINSLTCIPFPGQRSRNDARCWGSGFFIDGVKQPFSGWREHIPMEPVSIREWTVFSTWSVPRSYLEDKWSDRVSCQESEFCTGGCEERLGRCSWRISTVRSRCQWTSYGDAAGWKGLAGASGGAVIACSSESCVNKCIHQSKPRLQSLIHTRDNIIGFKNSVLVIKRSAEEMMKHI
jgi:hypothetical protein